MYKDLYKRTTFDEISLLLEPGSSVLDIGCGDGSLLELLRKKKQVKALGIDIKQEAVLACIEKGINAIQDDLDLALEVCRDQMYDVVILSQTLQVVRRPQYVLSEMVRIGKKAIVSFPNFGHYRMRLSLLCRGRMPRSEVLPFEWYDTPNIHHLTIRDFLLFCRRHDIEILKRIHFGRHVQKRRCILFPNVLAEEALFVIRRKRA